MTKAFALTIYSYFEGLIRPIFEVDDVTNVTETPHARVTEAAEKVHSHYSDLISFDQFLFTNKIKKIMLSSEYSVNDFFHLYLYSNR